MDDPLLGNFQDLDINELLRALARLGIFFKDFDRDVHLPNSFWLDWGFSSEQMKGDRWLDALHPDDRERVRERFARHESGQDEVSQSVYRVVPKSGSVKWILSKSVMMSRTRDGQPQRMIGMDYDITEMKLAQEEVVKARREAEDRAREAELLRRAGAAIAATLDRSEAVERVLAFLRSVVPFTTATVQTLSGELLEVIDVSGPVHETCLPGSAVRVSDVPEYERTLKTGEPQLLVCPLNPTPDLPSDAAESTTSWIGVPLVTRGTIIGLLTLAAESCEAFAAPHLAVAAAIGDYVALAIQNSRLYEETKEAASRDPLTGAFSRYWFLPFAEREIAWAQREQSPLSLVVYDLDHFKTVNDQFGHPAGDSVLSTLTRTLTKSLRTSDPLCRFGGEEFAVLLPGSDTVIARKVAERLCEQAAALRHECCEGRAVTISAGVASLGGAITTYDELIRGADRALYRAKNAGRNRVVVETDRT